MKTPVIGYASSKLHNWGEAPPKVLMVAEATGGGSGRHVAELAEGLLKAGCRVRLLYSELRAEQVFRDAIASLKGLRAHHIPDAPRATLVGHGLPLADPPLHSQGRRFRHRSRAFVEGRRARPARRVRHGRGEDRTRRRRCGRWSRLRPSRSRTTGRSRSDGSEHPREAVNSGTRVAKASLRKSGDDERGAHGRADVARSAAPLSGSAPCPGPSSAGRGLKRGWPVDTRYVPAARGRSRRGSAD